MAKIYYDQDADLNLLKDKTIAIIGYGIQGRGQALCLRDSGCRVVVSEMEGTPNYEQAKKDGFTPVAAAEAAKAADIIQILTQDHVQSKVYKESIKPYLKKGSLKVIEAHYPACAADLVKSRNFISQIYDESI